jgi:Mlc titration factor MtfA (ptsG expression regulator)
MAGAFLLIAVVFFVIRIKWGEEEQELPFPFNDGDYDGYVQMEEMPSDAELHVWLLHHFAFYHLLHQHEQPVFRARIRNIIENKWFAGREGLEVSNEMMLLITATMAQLTIGIQRFYFPRFDRIVIFPDQFYSRLFEQDVKGLTVFHSGIILVSWKHYEEGYNNPTDKLNLGLHEMAHALYLDYFGHRRMLYGFDDWSLIALPVFNEMQRNVHHPFLRDYAGANMHEFWAVSVEHFFEAPIEFRDKLPGLYKAMCQILKQDPAKRLERYKALQVISNR